MLPKRSDYAITKTFVEIADGNVMSPNPKQLVGKDWQLCLKTKAMADAFYNDGKNVHLTIFFCD